MICPKCGAAISDGVKFCTECGSPITAQPAKAQKPAKSAKKPTENARPSAPTETSAEARRLETAAENLGSFAENPLVGWSKRISDPAILAAAKKNRRATWIFALILVPLPLLGFLIYSLVSDKMETPQALMIGGIVSAVFLVFALVSMLKQRMTKPYEATVTEKKTRLVTSHSGDDNEQTYTEYVTVARTTEGKRKKIVERSNGMIYAYNYLEIGDRFRYHPQFNFPYELYDKTKAKCIYCVSCGRANSVHADRCEKCHTPLLK